MGQCHIWISDMMSCKLHLVKFRVTVPVVGIRYRRKTKQRNRLAHHSEKRKVQI
jgi:hypothetical protein